MIYTFYTYICISTIPGKLLEVGKIGWQSLGNLATPIGWQPRVPYKLWQPLLEMLSVVANLKSCQRGQYKKSLVIHNFGQLYGF